MKRKILSIFLSLAVALTMMPAMGMTAWANPTEEGIKDAGQFAEALTQGGEIKLAEDITHESATAIEIVGETTIDLNGHTLNITTSPASGTSYSIKVGTSKTDTAKKLTIKDSGDGGVLNVTNTSTSSYIIDVYGTLDIQGGTINITGGKAAAYGIYINSSGFFKMSGGAIPVGKYSSGNLNSQKTLRAGSGKTTITGGVIQDYYTGSGWTVSGGVFGTELSYEHLVSGKVCKKITTEGTYKNWYEIVDGTNVGLVGTTMYTDVAAFAKAIGGNKITVDGTKLTLTDNVNLGSASANKVTFLSDITIDLAGHSITGEINSSSAYMFYVNQKEATVTITDSVGDGVIKNSGLNATSTKYCYTIGVNKGTLNVNKGVTLEAYTSQNDPNGTVSTYPAALTILTANAKAELDGAKVIINCGETKRASAYGIVISEGICEIDNSTISVSSGSSLTAIQPKGTNATLKIGSKNKGKTTVNALCTGLNNQAPTICGVGYGTYGCYGNIFISNAEITAKTEKGTGGQTLTPYGVRFASNTKGTYEIGDNVSIVVEGTSSGSPEAYGLYAGGGGSITGSNVSIDVECENAKTRYGLYRAQTDPFVIDPGTGVTVKVNDNGYETGTNYVSYASSSGKFEIHGGTYKGGDLNGLMVYGGAFDRNPSAFLAPGYIAQVDEQGNWSTAEDTIIRIKNVTKNKDYVTFVKAVEEAVAGDELQIVEDAKASVDVTLDDVSVDLNGHDLGLGNLTTSGNVTITDKQATSFENAGTLTATISVGAGQTTISKCKHECESNNYKLKPFVITGGTEDSLAQLAINGVDGDYKFIGTSQYQMINASAHSRVTIGNIEGFKTSLTLNGGQNAMLFTGNSTDCSAVINDGEFSIESNNMGTSVFSNTACVQVNGGKFKLNSTGSTTAKIASNTNANVDLRGGYYVALASDNKIGMNDFFANATALAESNYNAKALGTDDPLYAEGYRYTVAEIAVAEINGKTYPSLSKAIDAATSDDTVKLLEDISLNEYTLSKNVNFDANGHAVKLTGVKPLTLKSGVTLPACFDMSNAEAYLEKKNGEKVYYKNVYAYTSPITGALADYDAEVDEQIVLIKNVVQSSYLTIFKTCTIDLNGFTLKSSGNDTALDVRNEGTVCTIKDSSKGQTGKITSASDYYTVQFTGKGTTFILKSGTIENTNEEGAGICAVGSSFGTVETNVIINGGKVTTGGGFAIVDNGQYSKNVNITINGGEVTADDGIAIYHPASGTITLNGGTISSATGIYIRSGKLVVPADSTVKVRATGTRYAHGTETGRAYNTGDAIVIDVSDYPGGNPTADVAGGAFYSLNSFTIASYTSTSTPAIKGFLKGGIYGANQERIDIMDVGAAKDLIAAGYKDIPNPDTTTKEDHPWMIGHTILITPDILHGTVTTTPEGGAPENATVVVTPTPDAGYYVSKLTYTVSGNTTEHPILRTAGQYSFRMPTSDVEINATFEVIPPTPQPEQPEIVVPVSGDKNEVEVKAEIEENNAKVETVTKEEIAKVGTGEAVTIDVSNVEIKGEKQEISEVTLTKETVENVKESEAAGLEIKLSTATVIIDQDTLNAVATQAEGKDIHLVVDKNEKAEKTMTEPQVETVEAMNEPVVLDAYFVSNGKRISDFQGGKVKILVEYPTDKPVRVWYVADNGSKERIASSFDKEKQIATFEAEHFSHYVIETMNEVKDLLVATGTAKATKDTIKWTAFAGAEGYDVFFAKCGKKIKKVKSTTAQKYIKKKLKSKYVYKCYVKAYKTVDGKKTYIAKSPTIHIAGTKAKYSNATKITAASENISLEAGKTQAIGAKIAKKSSSKTVLWKGHVSSKIRYYSADETVATVSNKGKITAMDAGQTYIYAISANGAYKKITVNVE